MPIIATDVKKKTIGIVTIIIIFTILGSLLVFRQPQNSNFTAYERQLYKIFEDAKIQFERIRDVILPQNITISVYTKQQAIDRWGKEQSNLSNDTYLLRQENIYKSLFLLGENESLSDTAVDWIADWTAVSVGNDIYVIYENFWPWDMPNAEATLIHELTHVWQNTLPTPTSYDADKAQNALIEGDASYMADYYKAQYNHNNNGSSNNSNSENNIYYPPFITNLSALLYTSQLGSCYPNVPDAVTSLNWFPYIQGKIFVSAIIDNYGGSWDGLNQCYMPSYMPSSTAQILHPHKYFIGETPKNPLASQLNDDSWTIIPCRYGCASDTYGEYFIYVMLNHWLNDVNQAQKIAAGWNGDTLTYYEKGNEFLFTWSINWDSTQTASAFSQAFNNMINLTQATPQSQCNTSNRHITLIWDSNTTTTLITCCSTTK
ncbi:MAG: basic secretory family protein [Candidatus Bathyarchaeota archaeon]|nr:basic secretory family protein [Candidatus Termiticorpusculum sp.]